MVSAYVTPSLYERAGTGLDTSSLLDIVGHLNADANAGDTLLTLGQNGESLPTDVQVNDQITLFDAGMSEQVRVTGPINYTNSTVPVTPLLYPHLAGTEYCTDGDSGSLADMLLRASQRIDSKCNQTLLFGTYTETLPLQTMSASINERGALTLRPSHAHAISVLGLSINAPYGYTLPLDITSVLVEYGRLITLPALNSQYAPEQGNLYAYSQALNNRLRGDVTVTYTAGYTYATLPSDLQEACILYASAAMARKSNPIAAASVQMSKSKTDYYLRGDATGISPLEKQANQMLIDGGYIRNAW